MKLTNSMKVARVKLLEELRTEREVFFGVNLNPMTWELVCEGFDYSPDPRKPTPAQNWDDFILGLEFEELVKWCEEHGFSCLKEGEGVWIRHKNR